MKILILTHNHPPDVQGLISHLPDMVGDLMAAGHRVRVITLSDRLKLPHDSFPYRIHRIKRRLAAPLRSLSLLRKMIGYARKSDVIFCEGLWLEALITQFVTRTPTVAKVNGDALWRKGYERYDYDDLFTEFSKKRYGLKITLRRKVRRWVARCSQAIIVPAEFSRKVLRQWPVPEPKIKVIPHGISPSQHDLNGQYITHPAIGQGKVIVTTGHFTRVKNLAGILRALQNVPEAVLVVIGDGPTLPHDKALALDLGLADRVVFTGAITRDSAQGAIAQADVAVSFSWQEDISYFLLEAMSHGVPVVATRVGGSPEVVEDRQTGLLVEAGDESALSAALLELINDPALRSKCVTAGREKVSSFHWTRMMEMTRGLLESCVN